MALDPIILAIRNSQPLSPEVLLRAKVYRMDRINELWAEIRILERMIADLPDLAAVRAERDAPIETA